MGSYMVGMVFQGCVISYHRIFCCVLLLRFYLFILSICSYLEKGYLTEQRCVKATNQKVLWVIAVHRCFIKIQDVSPVLFPDNSFILLPPIASLYYVAEASWIRAFIYIH